MILSKNKEKYKQYLKLEEDLANRLDIKEIMNHQVVFENSSNLFYNDNELNLVNQSVSCQLSKCSNDFVNLMNQNLKY